MRNLWVSRVSGGPDARSGRGDQPLGSGDFDVGLFGPGGQALFILGGGGKATPPLHLAFRADSRAAVDAFYKAGVANGGRVEMHLGGWRLGEALFDGTPSPVKGWLTLPQAPGLGFTPKSGILDLAVK